MIDLEHQYQLYLQRVNMREDQMHPVQREQLRQTFMAACGQILLVFRDEVSLLDEAAGVMVLEDVLNQVSNYFLKASKREN